MLKRIITRLNRPDRQALVFYGGLLLFVIVGVALARTWFRFQINPDAISYISIAEKYADFDFGNALNGYWGPLISWILVPFLWLDVSAQVAGKVILVMASAASLWLVRHLLTHEFELSKKASLPFVVGLAPVLLVWSVFGPITPDILFMTVLLGEVCTLLHLLRSPSWQNIILTGALGALLYYTKSFGFFMFLGQLLLVLGYRAYIQRKITDNLYLGAKAAGVAIVLILPFAILLSLKYHHPTISTTGDYNMGIIAPETRGIPMHPMAHTGPFEPPNDTAYSAWEDPTFIPTPSWSILDSWASLKHFARQIYRNLLAERNAIINLGAVSVFGFAVLLVYGYSSLIRKKLTNQLVLGVTVLTILGGYALILVEERYLWAILPITLVALGALYKDRFANWPGALAVVWILALGSVWVGVSSLNANKHPDVGLYNHAIALAPHIPKGSKIISSNGFLSVSFCYYNKWQCYGTIDPSDATNDDTLYRQIRQFGIEYYLHLSTVKRGADHDLDRFLDKYAEPLTTVDGTTIFRFVQ